MSKKSSKKSVTATVVVPAFNKKNAAAFAESIFSTKGGMITCTKLCDGSLQDGKDGKRTMHCAVGEAYFTFVNPSLKSVLQKDRNTNEYRSKFDPDNNIDVGGSTAAAIDALVEVANLKQNNDKSRQALAVALSHCVGTNDDVNHGDHDDELFTYIERSRDVAETWTSQVVPLLK